MSLNHLLLPFLLTLGALGQVPLAEFSTNHVTSVIFPPEQESREKIAKAQGSTTMEESVREPSASKRSMPFAPLANTTWGALKVISPHGNEVVAAHRIR